MTTLFAPDLPTLARRIESVTADHRRYKVSSGPELALLQPLPPDELESFARSAKCQVVRRMGGTIIEFTKSGALR